MDSQDSTEEIVRLAGQFRISDKGANCRSDEGYLMDWPQWAESHPQKGEHVTICKGRKEWSAMSCRMETATVAQHSQSEGKEKENSTDTPLSVMSWNILSDTWYQQSRNEDYSHTADEHGSWEGRFPLFLKWVEALSPDVLALQEVDFDKFESHLLPELQDRGYDGRMQSMKKHNGRQPCGVATFWRVDKLQLVRGKNGERSFSRSMALVFQLLKNERKQPCHESTTKVCIINVHLESAQTEIGADRRARQVNSPLSWASEVAPSHPVVVCGDCNTGADAALFRVFRNCKWHGYETASVYEHPATAQTLPVCRGTFLVPNHHYVIDHIIYSHETLKMKCVLNAFTPEEIGEHLGSDRDKGFPSALCPSDHIPVGAIFVIKDNIENCNSQDCASPINSEHYSQELSHERQIELTMFWESIKSQKPSNGKKRPTKEELEAGQKYKTMIKEWKKSLEGNPAELEYVRNLIKGRK